MAPGDVVPGPEGGPGVGFGAGGGGGVVAESGLEPPGFGELDPGTGEGWVEATGLLEGGDGGVEGRGIDGRSCAGPGVRGRQEAEAPDVGLESGGDRGPAAEEEAEEEEAEAGPGLLQVEAGAAGKPSAAAVSRTRSSCQVAMLAMWSDFGTEASG